MANYVDPAQWLCDWLIHDLGAGPDTPFRRIVPETPPDVAVPNSLPCAVATRIDGADPHLGLDIAVLDVETYATGPDPMRARAAALDRAEDIRASLRLRLTGRAFQGVQVSRLVVSAAPVIRPYDSRNQIRKAGAVYTLHLHRPL